jgi:hypothetical protein
MKTWVLKTNKGQYLCYGSIDGEYVLRYKYHLLKESNIVFDSDKERLQKIADEWNKEWNTDCYKDLQIKPVLVLYMFDEVKDKTTNAEKYTTGIERLFAFNEICNRYRLASRYTPCEGCKYREICDPNSRAAGVLAWLDDEVEEIPYKITRTYVKTIDIQASSENEALRFADEKFKELEETKTIKEVLTNHSSVISRVKEDKEDNNEISDD